MWIPERRASSVIARSSSGENCGKTGVRAFRRPAARRHDLDVGHPAARLPAHECAHRVRALGLAAEPVQMPAWRRERRSARQHARSEDLAARGAVTQAQDDVVPRPGVADRRHAPRERVREVALALALGLVRRLVHLLMEPSGAGGRDVQMHVDEAGDDGEAGGVHQRRRPRIESDLQARKDVDDPVALDEHRAVIDRLRIRIDPDSRRGHQDHSLTVPSSLSSAPAERWLL